jgi:tRNA nucleotidyltransferase/poly(A) polymerase
MQIDTNITNNLSTDEKEIFAVIRDVIKRYTPSTQAFAVGGWTRDKLLGIKSDDIDIMLSDISGEDFARLVTQHMGVKDAHTIRSNPEKSKHLTTSKAYLKLSSGKIQEVDFAQARSEVYKEDSRIPEIKPATPQDDAYRRDLTINSLFYNINSGQLEDFTGNGIKDLISDTIRTPMDPLKTFSDDPLRIWRVIRFAAKYNGKIDPETYQAMTDPSLRNEIKQKISRERISTEFIKMLKNPNPQVALQLLKDTGLLEDIIVEAVRGTPYEGKLAEFGMNQENPNHKLTLWAHTMEVVKNVLEGYKDAEPEKRASMVLAALMHDVGKLYRDIWGESKSHPGHRSYHGHEDESAKIVELILKYLKMEPFIAEISRLVQMHMRPHQFIRDEGGAKALRKFIRTTTEQSINWLDVFNIAVADAYAKDVIRDPNIVQEYQGLKNRLQEALSSLSPVSDKPELKPILNGNEIMSVLNVKPGPHMKEMMEFVKELRDENPNISKEEAIQSLKDKFQSDQIKQSSAKGDEDSASVCPKHLLKSKFDQISGLFQEQKYYEVLTILNQLRQEYGNDENITRLLAISSFKLLVNSRKCRHNDLIQYVMDKAQVNFFDATLCSYALGILLLLETETKDEVILEVAERTKNMSPETLKDVLSFLPNDISRPELKKKIEKML